MKQFIIAFAIFTYFLLGIIGDYLLIKNWKRELDTIDKTDVEFFLLLLFFGALTFVTGVTIELKRLIDTLFLKLKKAIRGEK